MREFFHHLFVPRESNNHRAKLLSHQFLLFIVFLLFVGQFFLPVIKANFSDVLGVSTNISPQALLMLVNQKRQEQKLIPLTLDKQLSLAAGSKASDMFAKNYWAHNAPDGITPWSFVKESEYDYVYAGENLARGFTKSEEIVDAWMQSTTHRDNLLSQNYENVGFYAAQGRLLGEETTLVVAMFGSKNINPLAKSSAVPSGEVFAVSLERKPLINSFSFARSTGVAILLLFIVILVLDLIIVTRRKIVRLVGHNIDHILLLGIVLIFAVLFSKGVIL
ncbi:MAG: hypothetical protein HYY87_00905 [Candidatus Levybacteria bacterium]|nr:hypothetical protein [Candidatus Levybacteria bacterium]MBI2189913.1 hypothetical protein [Candidatus Levybacteria bacterium]MBI3069848.1 hypothetical protein [Candidatus Levybacteria bacterium]